MALLRDPRAEAVWALLRERYAEEALDLDVDLALDLNVDSFGWMEIAVALQDRLDIHRSETDIAGIQTIRELLRLAIERRSGGLASPHEEPAMATDFERWLAPTGTLLTALSLALYALNHSAISTGWRSPAHCRAIPASYWAGELVRMFSNPLARLFCRAVHVFPVDAAHPGAVLESAPRVLKAGHV
jgi:acyl carrier protein